MKNSIYLLLLLISRYCSAQQIPLIPLPDQYSKTRGDFILNSNTPVVAADAASQKIAAFFQKEVLRYTGSIAPGIRPANGMPAISIKIDPRLSPVAGSYKIGMSPRSVAISASTDEGLFNGIISVLQMIRKSAVKDGSVMLACYDVNDAPRYQWRGFMLDESRHFFGKEKVKSILDWMAFYKLNRFHWHLTDQPGWRLEIKQYPRLALVGGIGNHSDKNAPAKYYTQEDINEIVSYAAERYITIIPEIDMPGHATAANTAYPEFSGGGSAAYPEFTFNPGKTEVYTYLTRILREADALFPSQMIHLGADEVSFGTGQWNTNSDVQQLMKELQLKDLKEVENYFVRRMGDSIINLNNKVLAWDEAAGAGLPADKTIIFWWRHDKPEQLKSALDRGYSVVLCPRLPMYFDFVQDSTHKVGRKWQGSYSSLEKVYAFSADQLAITGGQKKLVLGVQGNLWSETVSTIERLDYLLFPRICALAEVAWTNTDKKDYGDFSERLKNDIELFRKQGIYYYDPFVPGFHSEAAGPYKTP